MTVSLLFSYFATVAGFLLAVVLVITVVRKQHAPSTKIAWLLTIVLFPLVGVPLYLLFGGRKIRRRLQQKADIHIPDRHPVPEHQAHPADRLLRTHAIPGAMGDNRLTLQTTGSHAFNSMVKLMASAQHTLWVSTFSLGRDKVADRIAEVLLERARAGVQVRLLLDGVGSVYVKRTFLRRLRKAGGKTAFFLPLLSPFRPFLTNLRNHRKIAVADGVVAIAGGRNLAGKYMGPTPRKNRWVDLSHKVRGPAARAYADIFRSDWEFASGEKLELPEPPPPIPGATPVPGSAVLQIVPSGPDVPGDPLYDTLLSLIHHAKVRIWIATPYFTIDTTLLHALKIALRHGVDVRIVMPRRSDHLIADLARGPHLRALQHEGAHVGLMGKPMLHAKALLIDNHVAATGSANFDMRSLHLNFEAITLIYSEPEITAMQDWFHTLWPQTTPAPTTTHPIRDTLENTASLVAPLL